MTDKEREEVHKCTDKENEWKTKFDRKRKRKKRVNWQTKKEKIKT